MRGISSRHGALIDSELLSGAACQCDMELTSHHATRHSAGAVKLVVAVRETDPCIRRMIDEGVNTPSAFGAIAQSIT